MHNMSITLIRAASGTARDLRRICECGAGSLRFTTLLYCWRAVQAEIETLESTSAARLKEQQLLDYQLNEFDALALTDGEYLTLTEQHQQLSHADETQQILGRQIRQLVQAEESVTDQLRRSVSALTEIKDQSVVALVAPIESALVQIEEAAKDLQRYGEA